MTDNLPLLLIGAAIVWKFWPQILAMLTAAKDKAADVVEDVSDAVTADPEPKADTLVECGLSAFCHERRHRVGFLMKLRDDYQSGEADGVAVRYINYLIRCETGANDVDLEAVEEEEYEE
jgi:hypothetical protein